MAKTKKTAADDLQAMLDNPQDVKVRITINLDADLLDAIKERAENERMKYQPWLNNFLRDQILSEENSIESMIEKKILEFVKNGHFPNVVHKKKERA